jgi:hypothetical protein
MVQIACTVTIADWGLLKVNADVERWARSTEDDLPSQLTLYGEHSLWYTLQHP